MTDEVNLLAVVLDRLQLDGDAETHDLIVCLRDQAEAAAASARETALEEAAKIFDERAALHAREATWIGPQRQKYDGARIDGVEMSPMNGAAISHDREIANAAAIRALKSMPPTPATPSTESEVMPHEHEQPAGDTATPQASTLAPGADAPEPNFVKLTREAVNEWDIAPRVTQVVEFARRMYHLGLAARPKGEDAELNEAISALRRLTMVARTSGGVSGRDSDLWAACDVAEAVLANRTVDSVTHWMNGYAEMCQRAEAAEAKLMEREAELAKAEAVIYSLAPMPLGPRDRPTLNETLRDSLSKACTRHAARQQQKASAEPTEREGE